MNAQDVVQRAQAANLRLVRFLYCDNGGIIRSKATHATKLASRMQEGIGQTFAMQATLCQKRVKMALFVSPLHLQVRSTSLLPSLRIHELCHIS